METTKKKGSKKALVIAGIGLVGVGAIAIAAVAIILVLAIVLALGAHFLTPVVFSDFFSNASEAYVTPGIDAGFVPQGYDYHNEYGIFLHCGYMADGESASRIYVGETRYVELYTADGQPYTGHTGGITSYGDFVWIANDGEGEDNCVWVLSMRDIMEAVDGIDCKVTLETKFHPETRAACCYAEDGFLWIGEFNDSENYFTDESHYFEVADGEINKALICAYEISSYSEIGIYYEEVDGERVITPTLALSVTDKVQGFTKTQDGFAISTSYGLSPSVLYFYERDTEYNEHDATIDVNGYAVPVYFLDNDCLTDKVTAPPMSEEIVYLDGNLYVMFESACHKYIFGNLTRGRHIYSYFCLE